MIKMNEMMKIVLDKKENKECNLQIDAILDEIVCKTKKIKDCVIYDKDGTLEEEKINFNRIIQFVGDRTGYEASCNELRFERHKIFPCQFLALANELSHMLSEKYNGKKIVVYISLYEDDLEVRFHTYRKNERLWLDEDLNKYDRPILCCM